MWTMTFRCFVMSTDLRWRQAKKAPIGSAAAAALGILKLRGTSIAAAVWCSRWSGPGPSGEHAAGLTHDGAPREWPNVPAHLAAGPENQGIPKSRRAPPPGAATCSLVDHLSVSLKESRNLSASFE